VIGNETDLLALGLVRGDQAERAGLGPHRILRELTHRKPRRLELSLRQRPQEVRLILVAIASAPEQVPARALVPRDSRVMAGRYCARAPCARAPQERAELHFLIADHARHRRPARRILAGEV